MTVPFRSMTVLPDTWTVMEATPYEVLVESTENVVVRWRPAGGDITDEEVELVARYLGKLLGWPKTATIQPAKRLLEELWRQR